MKLIFLFSLRILIDRMNHLGKLQKYFLLNIYYIILYYIDGNSTEPEGKKR